MGAKGKRVSESAVSDSPYALFSGDLNFNKTAFGGRVLEMADRLAGTVARRHSGETCVTLFLDSVKFHAPAHEGEELVFKASVNRVWHTSMEVGVKIVVRDYPTGVERNIASMYFTFVAVDKCNKPMAIIPVIPQSKEEARRYAEADERRVERLKKKDKPAASVATNENLAEALLQFGC